MSAGKLPEGWVETQLENIVDILDSMRVPVNNSERQSRIAGKKENELYPYFGATGEVGKIDDYIFDEELVALGEDGVPFFDGHKNKAYMLYGKTWVNNHAHVIRAISGLSHNKYLCHYLNQFDYHDYVNGGTRLKLTQANMRKLPVSLAPLAEQKIIAEKLDTLLAQVDSTKARLEQIPQILKRFRQAVLAIAVNGQLTKEWRELSELSAIWPSLTLGELVTIERGSSPRPIKNYITTSESGVNWIKIGDAREGEKYIHSTKEKITPEGAKKSRKVTPGDFILSNSMSLGRAYIVDIEGYVHDGWFILRLPQHIDKNYFYYLLSSSQLQEQFSNLAVGGVVQNIRSELVKQAIVNIPSEKEQREIVRRVEQLFAYADTIEKQVNNALARVNKLTQSILAKAFRGELTAQWRAENPELISGENSAAALLEKIKAERAASGGKKASRKTS
ncbi:restriction endonuclease subunit S [Escherichia coli]|uniref:restriction endonuclease subunit S n=1 Tax=Escherichia coli TaxID=562 RepID=UPI0016A7B1A0|nr:restriction endonuclease subunit S [Escherichia coli]EFJ7400182.1 restriction endonuclease subunit S [Escherichia coli]EHL6044136.1 restriction endonuclease subunit S [Escherichia coli]EJH5923302.1 restriction endonuclease subunit S [Escherichia coli]EJH6909994.1 restriction endonuclease subunit S [Escherichia coli]ELH6821375.1 restriction endonuclease subunit S [Escherichia coli]